MLLCCREKANQINRPFPSSSGPLFQNEGRGAAFDKGIIFHSHANKTYFHKKGCAPSLILKVRVFGTRKWPVSMSSLLWLVTTQPTFLKYFWCSRFSKQAEILKLSSSSPPTRTRVAKYPITTSKKIKIKLIKQSQLKEWQYTIFQANIQLFWSYGKIFIAEYYYDTIDLLDIL